MIVNVISSDNKENNKENNNNNNNTFVIVAKTHFAKALHVSISSLLAATTLVTTMNTPCVYHHQQ